LVGSSKVINLVISLRVTFIPHLLFAPLLPIVVKLLPYWTQEGTGCAKFASIKREQDSKYFVSKWMIMLVTNIA
jgi:hypothetical protein